VPVCIKPECQFALKGLKAPYRKPALHREDLPAQRMSVQGGSGQRLSVDSFDADSLMAVLPSAIQFQEVQQIRSSFDLLMAVIAQRDQLLQHQLRTSLTASAIAHEINMPLGSLLLLCDQARQQLQSAAGALDVDVLVTSLHQQSLKLSRVVERMRMLLRNVPNTLQPTRLSDVLISSCTYVRHLLREHRVALMCPGLDGDDTLVLVDAGKLKTAATNLLANPIEAVATRSPGRGASRCRSSIHTLRRWRSWSPTAKLVLRSPSATAPSSCLPRLVAVARSVCGAHRHGQPQRQSGDRPLGRSRWN
jgi:signal transduction histidine kinase